MIWLAVGLGGGLGSLARHALTGVVQHRLGTAFPYAIFVVNVVGCLMVGLLAGAIAGGRLHVSETTRSFLAVGILGGFTTFSSFGLDTFTLLRAGQSGAALANAAGQVVVGLLALWAGFVLAH